jgi:hypothetical protein
MSLALWFWRGITIGLLIGVAYGSRLALVLLLAKIAIGQELELRRVERDADDYVYRR